MLNWIFAQPRRMFAFDAAGAALSAVTLGLILPALQPWFGLPVAPLRVLGAVAVGYAIASLTVSLGAVRDLRPALVVVMAANVAFLAATVATAVYHRESVTALGWTFIGVDAAVVLGVVWLEGRVLARVPKQGSEPTC